MKGKSTSKIELEPKQKKQKKSLEKNISTTNIFQAFWKFKGVRVFSYLIIFMLIISLTLLFTFTTIISRPHLNIPKLAHYHLRLQVFIDNQAIDFSQPSYQQEYSKDSCNAKLTSEPLHFHDTNGQLLHVHWQGITGGEVLKYYGINQIGGLQDILGYRFDTFPQITPINTKATTISRSNTNDTIHVYIGKQDGYYKASGVDFLFKDLELFLKKSKKRTQDEQLKASSFTSISTLAESNEITSSISETELNEINELIGNVVVFIEPNEPKSEDIQKAFNNLTPLTASVCGG
jgi:hypothetical protein